MNKRTVLAARRPSSSSNMLFTMFISAAVILLALLLIEDCTSFQFQQLRFAVVMPSPSTSLLPIHARVHGSPSRPGPRHDAAPQSHNIKLHTTSKNDETATTTTKSAASSSSSSIESFWGQQQSLLDEMKQSNANAQKAARKKQYDDVRNTLLGDTVFLAVIMGSLLWLSCDNPYVTFSYEFGTAFGLAYTYGLSKYVETIGGSADDVEALQGAGVGQARFAFLILLFVLVGKLRAYGLIEIPSIAGFFTYQLASLAQALRDVSESD